MMTDVYADVLFLVNFSMDVLSLYICGRLCAVRMRAWRLAVASAVGGIYAVGVLFLPTVPLTEAILFAAVCFFMSTVALKPDTGRDAFRYAAAFFVCSALCGGIMSAAYALLEGWLPAAAGDGTGVLLTDPWLYGLLLLLCLLTAVLLTRLRGVTGAPSRACLTVSFGGKTKRAEGIVDSGNLLVEPLSGCPCVVVPLSFGVGLVSERFLSAAKTGNVAGASRFPPEERARFRLVPASGLGSGGYLCGFRPDEVTVETKRKGRTRKVSRKAVICFCYDGCGMDESVGCVIPQSIL